MADEEEVQDKTEAQKDDLDEVFVEGFDEELPEEKEEKETKEEKKPDDTDARLKGLESTVSKLQQDKANLNKALHEERQAKKAEKAEDVKISEAELTKLLEEYKDDPQTMKNIMRYIAKEEARGAKKEALDEADVASKKKEVDTFLRGDLPDLAKDDSELRGVVNNIKKHLGLEDHPFGDLFAVGAHMAMNRKQLLQGAFDAGKKAALGDKGEAARKDVIKGNELLKGGKKVPGTGDLTAGHKDVAKRLGISDRRAGESDASYSRRMTIFKNIVNKPGAAVTVEG